MSIAFDFVSSHFREELFRKWEGGLSAGILNVPDPTFNSISDTFLAESYESCGLPQMIGAIYVALSTVHAVGGLLDTVQHLDVIKNSGNGFLFETYDSGGLFWAIQEAMTFYRQPKVDRNIQIQRIMAGSARRLNQKVMADQYLALYAKLLQRPMVEPNLVKINGARQGSQGAIP